MVAFMERAGCTKEEKLTLTAFLQSMTDQDGLLRCGPSGPANAGKGQRGAVGRSKVQDLMNKKFTCIAID